MQTRRATLRHRSRATIGALFALVAFGAFAAPASAADPFANTWTTAASTYRAVPSKGLIEVSITLKVANYTPDTYESYPCIEYYYDPYWGTTPYSSTCTRTKRWYIDSTQLYVEAGAANLKATSSAGRVRLHRETTGSSGTISGYTVTFPRIFNGQTRTIQVSYVIHAGTARSGSSDRVNGAYLSFGGFAQPVDSATVRMVVPAAFETSTYGGTVGETRSGSSRVYSSGPVDDTATFYVLVTGTNLAGYHRETIRSPDGRDIRIESWPGDDGWLRAVRAEATTSIGALEDAIGKPIPGTGPVTVREVAGGSLGDAYAGAFDAEEDLARIPEQYQQPGTVAHELSHAWFNGALFSPHWLSEGYAQWAERAVGANPKPCTLKTGSAGTHTGVELANWKVASPRATQAELDAVSAEYDASCGIVSLVATQIGPDRMRDVLDVLSTADGAYPGTHDASIGAANDWRAWLDAVDERGMGPAGLEATTDTAELLVRYGAATDGALAGRADARTALAKLRGNAGSRWTIPSAVYDPFATWDFDTASRAVTEMDAVIDGADEVDDVLTELRSVETPLRARVAAASSLTDLAAAHETVDRQLATAKEVAGAFDRAAADAGPIETIGLLGVDFGPIEREAVADVGALDVDGAQADVAVIDGTLRGATGAGLVRVGAVLGLVSLLLAATYLLRRRRRPATVVPVAEAVPAGELGPRVVSQLEETPALVPSAPEEPHPEEPAPAPPADVRDVA